MNILHIHMVTIAVVTAMACALPGVFLVLRGISLMSDAISHAILFGIVVMFMFIQSLESPVLLIGAAMSGLLTVCSTELLVSTERLKKDAAIGLVFPLLFSIAVILITIGARSVHLDVDMVLLGELAFSPFHRLIICGTDCGPRALWVMSSLLLANIIFIRLFYKELAVSIFDPIYARVAGFRPLLLYYLLMSLVSLTVVGAFDVVGSVVVVALMITPAATASLCTRTLQHMVYGALAISCLAAIGGYIFAAYCDVSIAGSIALMSGVLFLIVLTCSHDRSK